MYYTMTAIQDSVPSKIKIKLWFVTNYRVVNISDFMAYYFAYDVHVLRRLSPVIYIPISFNNNF